MSRNKKPALQPRGNMVQRQVAALMRKYLTFFLPFAFAVLHQGQSLNLLWYWLAMCQALQKTAEGKVRRLVINVPPRYLKSVTAIAFAAWMLGRDPSCKIMFVTYGKSLSKEHIDKCRKIMTHHRYQALFPRTKLLPGGVGEIILRTTADGGCRSVTVGGAATGFGADIIIIDDAMKADEINSAARREELDRFYRATLLTRLNNKRKGIIISIQQRLGEDDLPGRLIEAGAEHLCLPAWDDQERVYDIGFDRIYRRAPGDLLRPDDEPREVLEEQRRSMGPRDFEIQYLQRPHALAGNIVRTDKFHRFEREDYPLEKFDKFIQSWDLATSEEAWADYSVCMTFGFFEGRWFLLEVVRERLEYARLRDRIKAQHKLWQPATILLEGDATGRHLLSDLRRQSPYLRRLKAILRRPTTDKVTRMVTQTGLIEDGDILLPYEASWLETLLNELRAFPAAKHDDQVDALSQFLEWAKRQKRRPCTRDVPRTGRNMFTESGARVIL